MPSMQRVGALAAVVLLTFGAAACGGDDDGGAVAEGTTTTTTEDSGDTGGDTGGVTDFSGCEELSEAFANAPTASEAFTGSGSADSFHEIADYFDEVAADAPDEIQGDLETFASLYHELADALGGGDATALQELGASFSGEEFQEAAANLTAYFTSGCTSTG